MAGVAKPSGHYCLFFERIRVTPVAPWPGTTCYKPAHRVIHRLCVQPLAQPCTASSPHRYYSVIARRRFLPTRQIRSSATSEPVDYAPSARNYDLVKGRDCVGGSVMRCPQAGHTTQRLAQPRHCEEAFFADVAIQCDRTLGAYGLPRLRLAMTFWGVGGSGVGGLVHARRAGRPYHAPSLLRHCEEAVCADVAIQCHRTLGACGLPRLWLAMTGFSGAAASGSTPSLRGGVFCRRGNPVLRHPRSLWIAAPSARNDVLGCGRQRCGWLGHARRVGRPYHAPSLRGRRFLPTWQSSATAHVEPMDCRAFGSQ